MKKIIIIIFMIISLFNSNKLAYSNMPYYDVYKIAEQKYTWINVKLFHKINEYAIKYNFNVLLICALIQKESRGRKYARSHCNARSYMQVRDFHISKKLRSINKNIVYNEDVHFNAGCKYLKFCYKKAKYDIITTLRFYNQGHNGKIKNYKNWKYIDNILSDFVDSLEKLKEENA